jgi:hypothetical protein
MSFERRERNGRGKLKDAVANSQVASRKLRVRNESPIRSKSPSEISAYTS